MAQTVRKIAELHAVMKNGESMTLRFEYFEEAAWPPLAWIAECTQSAPVIRIRHGSQVETREAWFCEAAWDGDFDAGGFDRTDVIFGSGARLRENHLTLVSSGSTVDRLQFFSRENKFFVSNSLACLIAASNARLVTTFSRFNALFRSIQNGINNYERILPTDDGHLELVYFRNIDWDGNQLQVVDKPVPQRDFSTYEQYHEFLRSAMRRLADNAGSTVRNHRFGLIGALSSGYDSTATVVLGREVGMTQVFSFHTARGGLEDHGQRVADLLGLKMTLLDRLGWRQRAFGELPYLAATGEGEDVVFASAGDLLKGNVLLSGFQGDTIWGKGKGKDSGSALSDISRADISGLSFTEHRLDLGCIHVPVPFFGVRQATDMIALSNSDELQPWDVPGDYSRPIPRRIIEEAGIPRQLFGTRKKVVTNLFHRGEAKLRKDTRSAYFDWLKNNDAFSAARRSETPPGLLLLWLQEHFYLISRFLRGIGKLMPLRIRQWLTQQDTKWQRSLNLRINMPQHVFAWAVEALSTRYRQSTIDGNSYGTDTIHVPTTSDLHNQPAISNHHERNHGS